MPVVGKFIISMVTIFVCTVLPWTATTCCAHESPGAAGPRKLSIAVVLSAPLRPYLQAADAFLKRIPRYEIVATQTITLPEKHQTALERTRKELEKLPVDAYLSIGPQALKVVAEAAEKTKKPFLYCMVLDPKKLIPPPSVPFCGLSLNIPTSVQLQEIARTLPQYKRIGVLISTEANRRLLESGRVSAHSLGISLIPIWVDTAKQIPSLLTQHLSQIDALWILPDPAINSKALAQYVVKRVLFHNKPAIGYNPYFLEIGAAMAFVLAYDEVGKAVADLMQDFLRAGRCRRSIPPYRVETNEKILRKLTAVTGEKK